MKIKLSIKNRFTENVIFEYEKEDNTVKKTVLEAIRNRADLSYADLSYADLSYADLRSAILSYADLRSAILSYADLRSANLSYADLSLIKNDFWDVLLHSIPEIPFLKQNIIDGKIDGSTYDGECSCLSGTLVKGAMEQEAKEYAAYDVYSDPHDIEEAFIAGAKWQASQSESEGKEPSDELLKYFFYSGHAYAHTYPEIDNPELLKRLQLELTKYKAGHYEPHPSATMKWIKCSDRLPEDVRPPILFIIRWFELDKYLRIQTMTLNQLKDQMKWARNDYEWLDEQPEPRWPSESEIEKVADENYGWDNEKYGDTWNQVREEQKKAFHFAISWFKSLIEPQQKS